MSDRSISSQPLRMSSGGTELAHPISSQSDTESRFSLRLPPCIVHPFGVCLIALAWRMRADLPLVVAANRDEFYDRPTRPAHAWDDAPHVIGARPPTTPRGLAGCGPGRATRG